MDRRPIKVFISYAHDDEAFFKIFAQTLKTQLKSRQKLQYIPWDDDKIPIGSLWDEEIQNQLTDCDLAILSISDSFLASNYIKAKEFGTLLNKFPGTLLAPFLLSPCEFKEWDALAERQLFKPKGDKYDEASNEDFTFADLVRFNKKDGDLIPNVNIDRYIKDFITKIEEALVARAVIPPVIPVFPPDPNQYNPIPKPVSLLVKTDLILLTAVTFMVLIETYACIDLYVKKSNNFDFDVGFYHPINYLLPIITGVLSITILLGKNKLSRTNMLLICSLCLFAGFTLLLKELLRASSHKQNFMISNVNVIVFFILLSFILFLVWGKKYITAQRISIIVFALFTILLFIGWSNIFGAP